MLVDNDMIFDTNMTSTVKKCGNDLLINEKNCRENANGNGVCLEAV